ncbi:hypothetical protein ACWDFH_20665 [Streptomyces kronopolitis]
MLPALPPADRAAIVREVVDSAPEQAGATLAAVSTTLGPDQRDRLYDDLGAPEVWALRRAGTA